MFEDGKGRLIKIALFILMIHLVAMSIEIEAADQNATITAKKSIVTVIKSKGRGFILTDAYRFLLVEMTEIVDIKGKTISFYQLPVPTMAKIVYEPVPNGDPHALEIIIQEEIVFRSQPE